MAETNANNEQDCGVNLHADFPNSAGEHLDSLAFPLQNLGHQRTSRTSNVPPSSSDTPYPEVSGDNPQGHIRGTGKYLGDSSRRSSKPTASPTIPSRTSVSRPRFLAICVNTGGIYKTLVEIDISSVTSDAAAFLMMKNEYLKERGILSRFKFLIKPTTIEFVHVSYTSGASTIKLKHVTV